MIRLLVEAYRLAIAIIVVAAILASIALAATGGIGIIWAFALLAVSVFGLGISATLLSINDHLAAMRSPEATKAADESDRAEVTSWGMTGVAMAIFLVVAIAGIYYFSGKSTGGVAHETSFKEETTVSRPRPTEAELSRLSNQPDENGCVPRLAAEMGLSCEE